MTWERTVAAEALAEILAAMDPTATAFAVPPESLNVPAYVVGYPRTVTYGVASFGMDTASIAISVVVSLGEGAKADAMLKQAKETLDANPTLDGNVQGCAVKEQTSWRPAVISGINCMLADLVLEIRM